ncbi:MAG: G5P family DNA-binding protein [Magnetococcus sp. WYHC-3]
MSDFVRQLPQVQVLGDVESREYTEKETGKVKRMRSQVAYLVSVDGYGQETRQRVRIGLGADEAPRAPGAYVIGGASFRVGKFGDIELSRYDLELVSMRDLERMLEVDAKRAQVAA